MLRPLRFVSALSLAFLLAACPKAEPKKSDAPPTPKAPEAIPSDFALNDFFDQPGAEQGKGGDGGQTSGSSTMEAPAGDDHQPVQAKLDDPGAEPRAARKYELVIGKTETINVILRSTITQEVAGQKAQTQEQPPLVFALTLTPKEKTPEGEFSMAMKLTNADVQAGTSPDPDAAKMMKKMSDTLKTLIGLEGSVRVDTHGRVRDVQIAPGKTQISRDTAQFMPLLEQALGSVVTLLPNEPVGKGAKWETAETSRDQGITTQAKSIYTLNDIGTDGLQIGVATTRGAPRQPVGNPAEGATLKIDGTETLTVKVRLDRMVMKETSESVLALHVEQVPPDSKTGKPEASMQKITLKQQIDNAKP